MVAIVGGNSLGLVRTSASVLGANGQLGHAAVGRQGSGVTVNAVTGNLVIQNQDELLTGVGIDAAVMRTYNSLGLMDDDNGDNWRHSGQRKIEVVTAGSVLRLTDWDGSRTDFNWVASFVRGDGGTGAYVSKAGGGAFDSITYASGIWTLTDGDSQATQTFAEASAGRITSQRDASGNLQSFTYDASNRLSRITTANGEYTELVWNGTQLTQVSTRTAADALTGTKTRYAYDAQGRLATVTIDLSPGDNSIADGKTVSFQYTYDGTSKRVASIIETGSGNVVSFTYVQVGSAFRVASVTEAMFSEYLRTTSFSYDTTNRRTTITDALGKARVIAYDSSGNITAITAPADGTGAAPQVQQFTYNGNGDVATYTDGLGKVTSYTYDSRGNVTESVDPAGNRTRYEYNTKNLLLKKVLVVNTGGLTRLPGVSVDTAYYLATYGDILNAGELVDPVQHYTVTGWREGRNPNAMFSTNAYLAAHPDVAAAGVNPLEHWLSDGWREGRSLGGGLSTAEYIARYVNETTRYAYDSAGRLRFEVTTEGKVTEYRYNGLGQKISTIQYTNNWYPVGWTLTSTANVTEAQVAAWVAGLGATAAIQRTDTTYDFRGNVASEVSYADLNVNRVQFSKFEQGTTGWWVAQNAAILQGGLTSGTDATTGKKYIQASFSPTTSNNHIVLVSDEYFAATGGERLAVRAGIQASGGDNNLFLQVQFFDAVGNFISEARASELHGQFTFDTAMAGFVDAPANAQRMRLLLYSGFTAAGSVRTVRMTEPMITQASFDQTAVPAFSPGIAQNTLPFGPLGSASFNRVAYTYDQYGQLLAKTTSSTVGSEVYTYDGLGRVLSATDLAGAVTTTAYNDSARTTTVTLANGLVKLSQHDAQGNVWTYSESAAGVPSATETYKYDKLGRLRIHGDALGYRDFTFYDEAGRKTGYMDEKGQLTEFRYDAANRQVATIAYSNQVSAGAITWLYESGPATMTTLTGVRPAASNYDRWEWTVYDAADRVVQKIATVRGAWEGQSARVTSYSYDRAGNLEKTVESANVLSPAQVAQLMAQTPGTNLLKNPGFEGTAGWTTWNGHGIINAGSPFAGVWSDQHYLRANFTATAAGQAGSITVDGASNFAVTPGQQLSVKTGVEGVGPVSNLNLVVWWFDANGQAMTNTQVKAVSGQQVYGTQIEGLVTVPTGAASARLEMYMTASGAGSGWFVLIEPKVSVVSQGFAANLWQNTGFDNGAYNWNQWGTAGINLQGPLTVTTDAKGRKSATASFQASSVANNTVAIYSDSVQYFAPASEDGLTVSAEITSTGAVDRVVLWVEYWDANNVVVGAKEIGIARGVQPTGLQLSGFLDKGPANAKWMRVLAWAYPSAANTNASFSVRNLSVSTQPKTLNLWRNASFEQGTQYWNQWGNAPQVTFSGAPTIATDSSGNRTIQTTFKTTDTAHLAVLYSESSQFLNLVPGQRLAVSANVTATGAVNRTELNIAFFDANWQEISSTTLGSINGVLTNPTTISGFVNSVPANAKFAHLRVIVFASATNSDVTIGASGLMVTKAEAGQTVVPVFSRNYDRAPVHVAMPTAASADRITRNFYSKDGQLIGQLDGVGGFTQFAYDRAGRLARTTRYANVVPSSLWAGGNFSQILGAVGTSAKDRTDYAVYDGAGRVRFRLDGNLRPTEYVYNAAGQVIRTIEYAGPIAAQSSYTLTSVRSQIAQLGLANAADTRITRSVYDGAGRLNFTIDALGGVTSLAYDNATSQVVRTIRYANVYTGTGDPSASAMWAWTDGNQSAQNAITRAVYDKLGRLVYAVDAEGFITEYQYDLEGQVLKEIRYPGQYAVTDGATVSSVAGQIGGAATLSDTIIKTFAYDAAGQLTDSWDGEGVRTRFEYNAFGQVWRTVSAVGTADEAINDTLYDSAGRVLNRYGAVGTAEQTSEGFAYDGIGNLTTTVDARNTVSSHTYDANGNRLGTTTALGNGHWANSNFEYNAFGELVKATDPLGAASYNYYDKLGRVTLQIDAEGYATRTDYHAIGTVQAVTRHYSRISNLGGASNEPSVTVNTHAKDATTQFSYDRLGRVKTSTDAMGFTESFTYDAFGNKISQTNKLGGVTAYGYDKRGLMVWDQPEQQVWDLEGNPVVGHVRNDYGYDFLGRMVSKTDAANTSAALATTYAYNRQSLLTRRVDPSFLSVTPETLFTYDKRGNVILQTAPGNSRTWYWYDDHNRKIAEVSPVGTVSHFSYDAAGNLLWTKVFESRLEPLPASPGGTPPAPGGNFRQTDFAYDARSQLKSTTTQAVTVVQVNGDSLSTETRSLVATNTYDQNGRLIIETDARGGQIYHYYDKLGRAIGKVDQERYLTTWERDAEGNVLREVRYANRITGNPPVGGSTLPPVTADASKDRVTSFTYDKMGRRLTETREGVQATSINAAGQRSEATTNAAIIYGYNALGQVVSKTEANGDVTSYEYDAQGRMTVQREAVAQDFNASGTALTRKATYFYYDGHDRVVRTLERAEAPGGGLASGYAYGEDLVTRNYYSGDKLHYIIDPVGYVRYMWWNVASQKTADYYQRIRSDGGVAIDGAIFEGTLYDYDAAGRLTTQYQAWYNNTSGWTTVGPVTTFGYNGFGELTGKWVGGRQVEASDYDALGRVIKTNAGDGVWKFFAYDANGNATLTMTTTVGAANQSGQTRDGVLNTLRGGQGSIPLTSLNQSGVTATVVQYDWRNMAIATYEPGRTIAAADVAATTIKTLTRTQGYNAFGELQWELDAIGNEMAEGSLKEDRRAWYEYNTMGRLTRKYNAAITVVGEAGQSVWMRPTENYGYDLAGRLVASQDANGGWTTRTLRGGTGHGGSEAQVLTEFRPDGSTQQGRYDAFGQLRVSIDGIGRQTTQTYDKLGRLATATRATGATDYYEYDILGQRLKYFTSALTTQATQITVWVASGYTATQTNTTQVWVSSGYNETRTGTWQEWVSSGYWTTQTVTEQVWVTSGYWERPWNVAEITLGEDPAAAGYIWVDTSHWESQQVTQNVWVDTSHYETRTGTYTVWVDTSHWETQTTTTQVWIDTSGWQTQSIGGQMLVEATDYDIQGRVIKTRTFGDQVTESFYSWNTGYGANGNALYDGGTFFGWHKWTRHANGRTSTETKDAFGRLFAKTDMEGRTYGYSYNAAGLLTSQTNSIGLNESFSYYNTGQLASASTAAGVETYTYDAEGNRVRELLFRGDGQVVKNASSAYNALGWMTNWSEAGGVVSPTASVATSYDAVGNIRSSRAVFSGVDAYGNALGSDLRESWFRYDAMNRVTLDRGVLQGGVIVRATGVSTSYEYDKAGQRIRATNTVNLTERVRNPLYTEQPGQPATITVTFRGDRRTTYQYNNGGQISAVYVNTQQIEEELDPYDNWVPVLKPMTSDAGPLTAQFVYDGIGRMVQQNDFGGINGVTTATYSRTVSYDNAGRITSDNTATVQLRTGTSGYDTFTGANTYGYDALGTLLSQSSKNWKNGNDGDAKDTSSSYGYAWFDAAVQTSVSHDNDLGTTSNPDYTTTYTLDAQGRVTQAAVNDGVPKTVTYTLDTAGQIVRRKEQRNSAPGEAAPVEVFHRFGGKQMGMVGNNGTLDVSYYDSVRSRSAAAPTIDNNTAGLFRNGTKTGSSSYSDFAQSLEQINSYDQGSAAGSYTVRSGETLQSIAQGLWGDGALWYKLAEANGLAAGAALVEGQLLRIPAGITSNAHNAGTFTPYDAAQAMGDTMPTAAKPPKKPKCGVFGQILLQLIAYAVASFLSGPLSGVFKGAFQAIGIGAKAAGAIGGVLGAAAAQAAGSVVSQGVGVATGIQDKFNWNAVGMAAVSGGVGKGIGDIKVFGQGGVGKVLNRILTGAVREGVSQGIGVATGIQEKFSWAGVAAAGVSNIIPGDDLSKGKLTLARIGKAMLRGGAKTLASAATRSLIDGTSFGDNIIAALPSVVSQMLWDGAMNEGDGSEASGRPPEPGTVNDTARKNGNGGAVTDPSAIVVNHDAIRAAARALPSLTPDLLEVLPLDIELLAAVDQGLIEKASAFALLGARDRMAESIVRVQNGTGQTSSRFLSEDFAKAYGGVSSYALSIFELRQRGQYLDAVIAKIGRNPTDKQATDIANMRRDQANDEANLNAALRIADREVINLIGSVYGAVDFGKGAWRLAHGEVNFENGLSVAFGALGTLGAGKSVFSIGSKAIAAESATARAARLGAEGEQAVGLFGPKVGIRVPGANNLRFPDNLTATTLTEVKNVASQGLTKQMRDYVTISQGTGRTFELYVRGPLATGGPTSLTKPLADAVRRGEIYLKYIPGSF